MKYIVSFYSYTNDARIVIAIIFNFVMLQESVENIPVIANLILSELENEKATRKKSNTSIT